MAVPDRGASAWCGTPPTDTHSGESRRQGRREDGGGGGVLEHRGGVKRGADDGENGAEAGAASSNDLPHELTPLLDANG